MYAARPANAEPVVTTDETKAREYVRYGWRVEGPFVHADACEGAVEALVRAHAELDRGHDHSAETWADREKWTADRLGGQSGG